ncbi:O-antigen acetylase [Legionella busanensis]|uniref:O-antigen acetylase n=1 Tax=Legionella busanensis TaxID=190655 RepID=A0A378JJS3_9GAMM|nr:acyltransferase family protein [Legionella busanensis]STX51475.1 O-antigen acetylase [Legionella busanensis]
MDNNYLKNTSLTYRADIDGLRALAVISVVGFHALPHSLPGGFIGVDIFFVISGFLISTILFKNLENNHFSLQDFYAKRIRRIFPALLTVLVSCLIFGWIVLFASEFQQLGKHIAAGAGFVSNYILWQEAGYFDNAAHYKPLLHLWSLGIEEQFYLIWPLLLWIVFKARLNTLAILVFIILISFSLNIKMIHQDTIATFYAPQTRFWELICGSLLAWINLYKQTECEKIKFGLQSRLATIFKPNSFLATPNLINHLLAFVGLALIIYAHFKVKKTFPFPGGWAVLPCAGTILLIAAGSKAWLNRTLLANRFLVWIGLISFPLYLWHWPIISFIKITEPSPSKQLCLFGVSVAILLAWLTYQFIERPMRFGAYRRKKTITLIILMSFIAGVGGFIYKQSGLVFKSTQVSKFVDLLNNPLPSVEDFECGQLIPTFKQNASGVGCKLSKNTLPDIMFIGDSHTGHYRNAIWQQFSNHSVLFIVEPMCLPFSTHHFLKGECRKKFEAILEFIKTNGSVKKVYLSGYWSYLMTGGFAIQKDHWRQAKPLTLKKALSFQENGRHLISTILAANKEVIFLKDIPDLDFNINTCFKLRPLRLSFRPLRTNCWMDFASYQKRIAPYDKVIDNLLSEFPQVKLFDPRPLFCSDNKCYARDAELPYYFNGDHLNHYGAEYVFKNMQNLIS